MKIDCFPRLRHTFSAGILFVPPSHSCCKTRSQARGMNDWLYTVANCQRLIGSLLIQTRFPSHQLIYNKPFTQFPCAMDRITRPQAIFVHPRRVCQYVCAFAAVCFLNEMVSPYTIILVTGLGRNTHVNTAKSDCIVLSNRAPSRLSLLSSCPYTCLYPSLSVYLFPMFWNTTVGNFCRKCLINIVKFLKSDSKHGNQRRSFCVWLWNNQSPPQMRSQRGVSSQARSWPPPV